MSGGHFDYQQYHIRDIADSIEEYLYGRELDEDEIEDIVNDRWTDKEEKDFVQENKHTMFNYYEYDNSTLDLFKEGLFFLKLAHIYAQRIDWLLSGDDGEDSFKRRLKEELNKLYTDNADYLKNHPMIIDGRKL